MKGWGEPFTALRGGFRYPQDIRASQMKAVLSNARFRIEIVANLTAYLAGTARYERLTLTAAEIIERATPRLYDVSLDGKEDEIVRRNGPPAPRPTPMA